MKKIEYFVLETSLPKVWGPYESFKQAVKDLHFWRNYVETGFPWNYNFVIVQKVDDSEQI